MVGSLLLITGATGFVGFRVLCFALEYGYRVRAVVRSEAKAEILRSNSDLKALGRLDHLEFTFVPDFVKSGAFDMATEGVDFIIHCASPIPSMNTAVKELDE